MSQVRLIIFIAAFITLTGNSKLLEKTLLVYPLSENWLFVCSLLIWLFVFLSALLLIFCYRNTIKPILIILLMISSIVSYAVNNFGLVFDHNMITNTFETNTTEFLDQANFKSFLYLLYWFKWKYSNFKIYKHEIYNRYFKNWINYFASESTIFKS